MNEKSKAKMREQKLALVNGLKTTFPTIALFEDEMAKDEEEKFANGKYHSFVLQMGDFRPSSNILSQRITVDYYSEDRDDFDEMILDIISTVCQVPTIDFIGTTKVRARVKDTQRFCDVVTIEFRRLVKRDC